MRRFLRVGKSNKSFMTSMRISAANVCHWFASGAILLVVRKVVCVWNG